MIQQRLDTSYTNNSIKTALYELRFKYNTDADYFYFDLYDVNGAIIRLHNRVVTGYDYGVGVRFYSVNNSSYATAANVQNFTVKIDG